MKKKKRDPLRLINWANDGFPPIDLASSVKDVVDLIQEVEKLRKIVASIEKPKTTEPCYQDMVAVWCDAYPMLGFNAASGRCINQIIIKTRKVLIARGKEETCESLVNAFKYVIAYVKRVNHFCDGKPLTTWNNQYLSIIHEISNGKSSKNLTTRERINNL